MANKYSFLFNKNKPQTMPLNKRQVQNNAGGYGYVTSNWQQVERFLMLGTLGGTFHVNQSELTDQNIESIVWCIQEDGQRFLSMLCEINKSGRAPKRSQLFLGLAFAIKHGDDATRRLAHGVVPVVCSTASNLFEFLEYCKGVEIGWGRGLKRAVQKWYDKPEATLAYQLVKYRQRNGYTHRDVLRLGHPKTGSNLVAWAAGKAEALNEYVSAYEELATAPLSRAVELIREFKLPREAVPTNLLSESEVWRALLSDMPMMAMIRNIGKMSTVGLLDDVDVRQEIVARLTSIEKLKRSKIHPLTALIALRTYQSGKGVRGSLTWEVHGDIVEALQTSFYGSFESLPTILEPMHVSVDVSGSMNQRVMSMGGLLLHEIAACFSLCAAKMNAQSTFSVFDTKHGKLDVHGRRIDDVLSDLSRWGGGTDLNQAIEAAKATKSGPKCIVVFTDNETWAGHRHCDVAWADYRKRVPGAKLAVASMVANHVVAFDDQEGSVLQMVGVDSALPNILATFFGIESEATSDEE